MPDGLIAVVDDDEAVRLSMSSLLGRAGFDVKTFDSGDDFLNRAHFPSFACILLDVRMPGTDGLAVLRRLAARGDSPPVLVVTGHGDIPTAVVAMKLGARDFIEKPSPPDALLESLHRVIGDGTARQTVRARRAAAEARVKLLSEREREVLQGILRGLQNKLIAFELGLSTRTVEAYRSSMLLKLGVRGTADAVRLALAAGLSDDAPPPAAAPPLPSSAQSVFRFK